MLTCSSVAAYAGTKYRIVHGGRQTVTATYGTGTSVTFAITINRASSGNGNPVMSITTTLPTGATSSFST
jgi:hypothetical protein